MSTLTEGWRIWRIETGPLGIPQLGPPLSDSSYTLSTHWEGNQAIARCIQGCPAPPGPQCSCGIRFYPHAQGFLEYAERIAERRTDELLRHRLGFWGRPMVIGYGRPVGPSYQDPKGGLWGGWHRYWRTGRFDLLALLGWPEYPMIELAARYGRVATFDMSIVPPTLKNLELIASQTANMPTLPANTTEV